MTQVFANDALNRAETRAREVLAAVSEGDMLRTNLAALRRLLKILPVNTVEIRQKLADTIREAGKYAY